MRLIINADDLGFTKGINYGILDAFETGIVSSASLLMNMSATTHALSLFKNKAIGLGVQLNVSRGKPLIENQALTNEEGFFLKRQEFSQEHISSMMIEFEAQIKKALDLNMSITHLSSYDHVHMANLEIFKKSCELAKKYKLKIRCDRGYKYLEEMTAESIPSTKAFSSDFFDKTVHVNHLIQIINRHSDEDSLEIMVHPGFICGDLIYKDSYQEMRVVEHSILCSNFINHFLKSKKIELINFGELESI